MTSDEQAEVAERVQQIKEFVRQKYSLPEAQLLSLDAKLDDIQTAAARVGRKDLVLLAIGLLVPLLVTALLPPEAVHDVLAMLLHGLHHLLGGGGSPPQLPHPT